MIEKTIIPEEFDFGMPSVDFIGVGSKGLDKTAMVKRASAFEDVVEKIEKKANRSYLHVITTGAFEKYGANANRDAWNGESFTHTCPYPENTKTASITFDGGLSKYHDDTYMKGGSVFQEHKDTRDKSKASGEVIAARYNPMMKRGELLIAVDTDKWAARLQKKASGDNIYLSIGADVPNDTCMICHRIAKTASEHCEHFTKHGGQIYDSGERSCVMNDTPNFYDISGVNVPADRISFVLQKVASGASDATARVSALVSHGTRRPILFTKAAQILDKLSAMEKKLTGMVEGDEVFEDDEEAKKDFVNAVVAYPSEEVISSCNRKGILLSPDMLFKLLGAECNDEDSRDVLFSCDDDSLGDCSDIFSSLNDAEDKNVELLDGSFDTRCAPDISLESILDKFMPEFGTDNQSIGTKSIHITITSRPSGRRGQRKRATFNKYAQNALRRTYARYVVSFAEQNDEPSRMNALRKIALYGK